MATKKNIANHERLRANLEIRAQDLRGQLDSVHLRWEKHHEWLRRNAPAVHTDYDFGDVMA